MFVCGVRDENVRQRLPRKQKLTLQHTMDICRPPEAYEHQVKLMASTSKLQDGQLNAIKWKKMRKTRYDNGNKMWSMQRKK